MGVVPQNAQLNSTGTSRDHASTTGAAIQCCGGLLVVLQHVARRHAETGK